MTCKDCLMFTHCRYDLHGKRKPCEHFKGKRFVEGGVSLVDGHIDELKDLVKVVRCKDCKSCLPHNNQTCICKKTGRLIRVKDRNNYCSYGERKNVNGFDKLLNELKETDPEHCEVYENAETLYSEMRKAEQKKSEVAG